MFCKHKALEKFFEFIVVSFIILAYWVNNNCKENVSYICISDISRPHLTSLHFHVVIMKKSIIKKTNLRNRKEMLIQSALSLELRYIYINLNTSLSGEYMLRDINKVLISGLLTG